MATHRANVLDTSRETPSRGRPPSDARPAPRGPGPEAPQRPLRWWREVALVAAFYAVYSLVRNAFGSAAISPDDAFANAVGVLRFERALGLDFEYALQQFFLTWPWVVRAANVFYGTFHFVVTAGVLVWLFARHPRVYRRWRTTLGLLTALALIGYSAFPLMPPRLLGAFGPFGGRSLAFRFVDALETVGGLWSFESDVMARLSNQYAAMPSLHVAWAVWCALAVVPRVRSRPVRSLFLAYPLLTLFSVIVTGNHYWLDGAVGVGVLGVAWWLAGLVEGRPLRPGRASVTSSAA
jgi:hypothetical protein